MIGKAWYLRNKKRQQCERDTTTSYTLHIYPRRNRLQVARRKENSCYNKDNQERDSAIVTVYCLR